MVKNKVVWTILSVGLVVLTAVLTYPSLFGFSKSERLEGIQGRDGFVLTAEMPPGLSRERKRAILFPDSPVISENAQGLPRPGASSQQIANAGRGRYQISGSKVQFSTSDAEPPGGREYTIRAPMWSLGEALLLPIWIIAAAACAITARLLLPGGAARLMQCSGIAYAALALAVGFAAILACWTAAVSDQFFLGLAVPTIWAVLMGVLANQKPIAGRIGLLILAVLPAVAGFFYYGLNAASDSSFLVGGIIPCSDARLHFLQAAEIAVHGTTRVLFNGRFLYPAFYAVILDAAGLNILLANLVVSLLVMLGLAVTCRLVARRIGCVGAAGYCLLFWLYFRVYGCGLVMTENVGLLLGTLGFGFLLVAVDRNRVWPVYVALLFFGLGSVARPGALFILPALALYAGGRVWMAREGPRRMAVAAAAVFLGLAVTAGSFGANHLVMKSLSSGEGKAFGNFAFTLHGLLNGTKWSTSANAYGWDTSSIMEHNIQQIKESPLSLVRGVFRAYEETLKKKFLFRFGPEKRLATSGLAMFILALLGCWLWSPLRRDAGWIILTVTGILASIPFAPPWDAGVRPYAASIPIQIFLAAAGFAMLLNLLARLAQMVVIRQMEKSDGGQDTCSPALAEESAGSGRRFALVEWLNPKTTFPKHVPSSGSGNAFSGLKATTGLIGLSALCLVLVLPAPLILKATGFRHPVPSETPALLPGSRLLISGEGQSCFGHITRAHYFDRLSDFQAAYPDKTIGLTSSAADFVLAIDWRNLETVLLPWPDGEKGGVSPIPGQ